MNFGELDLQFVFNMVAATGVLVAAIYHIMILRYNMRARAMEICRLHTSEFVSEQGMQRYFEVMSMEWKDYEDFDKKYGPSNPEICSKWFTLIFTLEASGIIIKNKVVKPEQFYDLGARATIETWEKFKDVISELRKVWGQDLFNNAEFLVQEMQKIRETRLGSKTS